MPLPAGNPASTTAVILRHIESLGCKISVFDLPPSLHGYTPAKVEMHAVGEDRHIHIVTVEGEGNWTAYTCACRLAKSVGIDLKDG